MIGNLRTIDEFTLLNEKAKAIFATDGPRSHFFGYYDKTPFDGGERYLLCHAVDFDGRMIRLEDKADIGVWDIEAGSYTRLAETQAFNWQQGAMLQWVPGTDNSRVVFNDRAPDRFTSTILDLASKHRQGLPTTVHSITPDGRYAVTPRFERLYYTPAYHYEGVESKEWDSNLPDGDALFRVDLKTGLSEPIVEIAELAHHRSRASMEGGVHYVDHIWIDPTGSELIFLHRWKTEDLQAYTRLYRCDIDGGNLRLYPDSGRYSHASWLDDKRFVIWGRPLGAYARLRRSRQVTRWLLRPFLSFWRRNTNSRMLRSVAQTVSKDRFLVFDEPDRSPEVVGSTALAEDGHPSICPTNPDVMLTDTYEDPQSYRHLLLCSLQSNSAIELGRFYSPPGFNQTGFRCDLHPRWSPSGRLVCVDTIRGDRRQMLVIDVSEVLGQMTTGER